MFTPNVVPSFSHREQKFEKLYFELTESMKYKFNLHNYIIIPITGSGTLANEIVISSIKDKYNFNVYNTGEFGERLLKSVEKYHKQGEGTRLDIYTAYETSESSFHTYDHMNLHFVDAISSFPFYIPRDADIFTTVNSKILGAPPGLSFIFIKKDTELEFKDEEFSYLSLKKYLRYHKKLQTPNTPCITLFQETLKTLENTDYDEILLKVLERRKVLNELLPADIQIGEGHVFTFMKGTKYDKLIEEFNLYNRKYIQIFLYTGTDEEYDRLFEMIRKI